MPGQRGNTTVVKAGVRYRRRTLVLFACAYAPFYLNDVFFLVIDRWWVATVVDYATRLLVIAAILIPRPLRILAEPPKAPIGTCQRAWLLLSGVLLTMICLTVAGHFWLPVSWRSGLTGVYLPPDSQAFYMFDLLVGLWLVAVSEELLCRRIARNVLQQFLHERWKLVAVSALLFGLMHWGNGLNNVIVASLDGVLFMLLFMATGRLWPVVVVHYAINFLIFSGMLGWMFG